MSHNFSFVEIIKEKAPADSTNAYWNPSISSTIECGQNIPDGNKCIQKQISDPDYVSAEECEAYGNSIGVWRRVDSFDTIPTGCFQNSGSDSLVFFNIHSNTLPCTTDRNCIKKNLGRDLRYVSAEECEAYGNSIGEWRRVDSFSSIPTGCFRNSGSDTLVFFNTHPNTLPCTTDKNCIQKVPNKLYHINHSNHLNIQQNLTCDDA